MAGGGGERVLWAALKSLHDRYPAIDFVVYTGDSPEQCKKFLAHVSDRFRIDLDPTMKLSFIHLRWRTLLEARHYPVMTMIGQSLGSVILAAEALRKFAPDVCIDTTGCAFILPVFRLLGLCRTAAYVHYPTISSDMLQKVKDRQVSYNNSKLVSRYPILSRLKLTYYRLFAALYSLAGACCDVVMTNSSWTFGHIKEIWSRPDTVIVYPPCNVRTFLSLSPISDDEKSNISLVSIGQFRPEKDHPLQLRSLKALLNSSNLTDQIKSKIQLHFVGSCRNSEDEDRVMRLNKMAGELGLEEKVVFHLNAPFDELIDVCRGGLIALHSMWNEHFGIGVVEGMAAGLLTVAHGSGGPKMDIVVPYDNGITGYLAVTEEEYADVIARIILADSSERDDIRKRARQSVARFSDEIFFEKFAECLSLLLPSVELLKKKNE